MYQCYCYYVVVVSAFKAGSGPGNKAKASLAYLHHLTIMQVVWAELHSGPAAVGGVDLSPLPNGEVRQTEAGSKLNC